MARASIVLVISAMHSKALPNMFFSFGPSSIMSTAIPITGTNTCCLREPKHLQSSFKLYKAVCLFIACSSSSMLLFPWATSRRSLTSPKSNEICKNTVIIINQSCSKLMNTIYIFFYISTTKLLCIFTGLTVETFLQPWYHNILPSTMVCSK